MVSTDSEVSPDIMACRLCNGSCHLAFPLQFRQRHPVSLYQCQTCGLLQTEKPYWLEEAYDKAISALDTGVMRRNLLFARIVSVLLRFFKKRHGVFLDYGGGHGIFTRLMRDCGYDFRWHDLYAENLYANGFAYEPGTEVSGITAFEVLEHLENPKDFFKETLGGLEPDLFIASTSLFKEPADPTWHYFYPDNGQHIAFYQKKTLNFIADQYGYHYSGWRYFHLFSKRPLPKLLIKCAIPLTLVVYPFLHRPSLHLKDYQQILAKLIKDH